MSEAEYDVVIVGAGITGALVAKTLHDHGVEKVLILEAGRDTGATAEGYRTYVDNYYTNPIKVPNSPYPENKNAPTADLIDNKQLPIKGVNTSDNPIPQTDNGYLVEYGPYPFMSDYARAQGGTTLHWLGTCLRMLPNDYRMHTRYGQEEGSPYASPATDWPVDHEVMKDYYARAEREIGVSADVEEQHYPHTPPPEKFFGEGYQYPMRKIPQSYLDQQITDRADGMTVLMEDSGEEIEVKITSTPQGRNSTPNPEYEYVNPVTNKTETGFTPVGMVGDPETGTRCEGNSSCTPICPVQAKYNALKTLHAIPASTLEIRAQSVASKVLIGSDGRVSGIEYKHYEDADDPTYTTHTVTAKFYVLAAHAIENAKLLLASGAANSSDQVGRNLMDHLCLLTWGLMPMNVGAYRGPGATSGSPSFRDGEFRKYHSAFIVEIGNWGWNWPAFSPVSDVQNMVNKEHLFGGALRDRLARTLPRQFRIAWELEQPPEQGNRVTIDDRYLDPLGNYRPVIHYDIPEYMKKAAVKARRISCQLFQQLGVEDFSKTNPGSPGYFEYNGEGFDVAGAGHVVGTHRMGDDPGHSVVDRYQRTHDHDNLFLVGCGNMPTLGTGNPTLTISALAIWAADTIASELG